VKAPIQSLNFALLVSAGLLSTAQGFQAGLVNVSPTAIEIHAEAIATFDPHAPARRRLSSGALTIPTSQSCSPSASVKSSRTPN
jgi:hypothetical protein